MDDPADLCVLDGSMSSHSKLPKDYFVRQTFSSMASFVILRALQEFLEYVLLYEVRDEISTRELSVD